MDQRTRRVFACDVSLDYHDTIGQYASSLDVADAMSGKRRGRFWLPGGCAGIVLDRAGGRGFIFDGKDHVVRFDPVTGHLGRVLPGPAVSPAGILYIGDKLLVAYNAGKAGDYPGQNPPINLVNGTSFTPDTYNGKTARGGILKLDPATGRTQELSSLDPHHWSVLAVDSGTKYVYLEAATFVEAVNVQTGRRIRLSHLTGDIVALGVATDGAGGHAFVGRVAQAPNANPSASGPMLYIDVYDLPSGKRLRSIPVVQNDDPGYFSMTVDPVRGIVTVAPYIGSDSLYLINWRTSQMMQSEQLFPGWPVVAADPVAGRVYITTIPVPGRDEQYPTDPGWQMSVSEANGQSISWGKIGQNAQALLVDDMTNHVFTASGGITTAE